MLDSPTMDRVLRTIAAGITVVTLFYTLFLPGGISRRLGGGLVAASVAMGILLWGMALSGLPLQAGYLQIATALGMLCIYLTVEVPSRGLAAYHGLPLANVRGVSLVGMIVACFLAAWAAGMPESPSIHPVHSPLKTALSIPPDGTARTPLSEETHVRP
jgi:hypothetical protein